jgi:hypothetical protein
VSGCDELSPPCDPPEHPTADGFVCGHDIYCRANAEGDTGGAPAGAPPVCAESCRAQEDPALIYNLDLEQVPPALP